jgi:multicomponent Na+:H+ antiporter subunit C
VGTTPVEEMSDPLPQAMVLTAIVITLGMTAFLLAMAYRSWQLNRHDEVQDDLEDRRIARMAAADVPAFLDDTQDTRTDPDAEAAEARDETGEEVRA